MRHAPPGAFQRVRQRLLPGHPGRPGRRPRRHATLVSVHRIPADRVRGQLSSEAQTTLSNDNDTSVCAVAFKGTFAPGQVALAPPDETGRYALVLVTSRHLHVLAAAVLDQLPHSLGKRTI